MDETNGLYPVEYYSQPVAGIEGVDGPVGDFLTKHKKKILVGVGITAIGLGALLYLKHSRKQKATQRTGLGGVSRRRKKKRKSTTRRRTVELK